MSQETNDFDVVIVGAGPAGSTCALMCSKIGLKTVLIEKNSVVGESSVCGGLLPAAVLSEFKIPNHIISRWISGYKVYSPSGKQVLMNFSKQGATAERKRLDKYLAEMAARNGTKILTSHKACDVRISSTYANVICTSQKGKRIVKGKIVVLANGPKSQLVERIFGKIYSGLKFAIAIQKHYPLINTKDPSFFEAYHDPVLGYGLGWISPMKDYAIVGAGVILSQGNNLQERFEEFVKHYDIAQKVDLNRVLNTEGALIPFDNFPKKLFAERFLVVGDAGMLCNPFSGDGVYYAMKSGEFAANTISECFKLGDFSEKTLSSYQNQLEDNFREQFKVSNAMQKQIYSSHRFAEKSLGSADQNFVSFLEKMIWTKEMKSLDFKDKFNLLKGIIKARF